MHQRRRHGRPGPALETSGPHVSRWEGLLLVMVMVVMVGVVVCGVALLTQLELVQQRRLQGCWCTFFLERRHMSSVLSGTPPRSDGRGDGTRRLRTLVRAETSLRG